MLKPVPEVWPITCIKGAPGLERLSLAVTLHHINTELMAAEKTVKVSFPAQTMPTYTKEMAQKNKRKAK